MIKILSLIVILTFVGGSLFDDFIWQCRFKRPIKVPETTEELLHLCQKEKACVIRLEEAEESSRKEKDADEVRETSRTFNYLNTTCNEDNPTFKAIFNNLQCGASVLKNLYGEQCLRPPKEGYFVRDSDAAYMQIRHDFGKKEFFSECLNWFTMSAKCRAITLGYHCGREMRDAFEAVTSYARFWAGPLVEPCRKEYLDSVQPVYEVYEAALLKELIRKDAQLIRKTLPKLTVTVNYDKKMSQVFVSDPHVTLTSEFEVQPKMVH